MKATDFPVKQVAPGLPANDAGNSAALKATLWRFYVRPFGYGETKQTLVSSNLKSTRHGFSSFLKYGNSPYLGNNGMYAPTNPTDLPENRPYSKYTSDGIVPYPFIQPGLTASNGNLDVTVDWDDAEYTSGKNINDLVCMFPEEELHELRDGIGNLPAGWAGYTQQQRQNFYGDANYSMRVDKMGDGNHVEWVVTQPNHATPNLFREANPGAPFTNANTGAVAGGSASHHQFVFTRLYRTFAQFKKDPSNDLGASIIAGAMSEFKEHQRNRVGAPGVYIVYDDGPGGHTMMTFPFRWLMNHRTNTVTDESFNSQFETYMSMMGNPTGTLQATLTDTGATNVAPGDWVIGDQGVKMVARNITLSGVANTGAYPYTTEAHPKYNAYVHNAIGNMFEIPAGVSGYTTTATHLTLKDIYWELDEFTDGSGAPTIVLCFNNYGTTFDLATTPMAYHLFQNTGVEAVYNRDQAGVGAAQNNQDLAALNVGAANGFNRINMSIPFANFKRIDNNGADDILTQQKFTIL